MIPAMHLAAWGRKVPWSERRQVEQDLIICRAIVAIFGDAFLRSELRFRGGTALHKLHFPVPLRYSEDLDLVRTKAGPIGPVLDGVRRVLEPWLGKANFDQSPVAPKLRFRMEAEDGPPPIRLKIEINTSEIEAYDTPWQTTYAVESPWFNGTAEVSTYSREELLSTKLRALLQRNKGRDLFDLARALDYFPELNAGRVAECFGLYLARSGLTITRAVAEERMFAKLENPAFLTDLRPLLPAQEAARLNEAATHQAFARVFAGFVVRLPGEPWARTESTKARVGLDW